MKRLKKDRKQKTNKQLYKVAIHTRELFRGLTLAKFLRYEYIETKPTYDTHWLDCTNSEWARWDKAPFNTLN